MAIVICPQCGHRTSSVGGKCRNCDALLSSDDPAKAERLARRARRARSRKLSTQAALATLLATAAGLWLMFGDGPRSGGPERWISAALVVVGLAWYAGVRALLWLHRHRQG